MRKLHIANEFDIPRSTPQQRSQSRHGGNYASAGLKYARAAWKALLEKHVPAEPFKAPRMLSVELYYHTSDKKLDGRHKVTRPDATNILKLVEDVLAELGYYADDNGNVVFCAKYWTVGPSKVKIIIEEITEWRN